MRKSGGSSIVHLFNEKPLNMTKVYAQKNFSSDDSQEESDAQACRHYGFVSTIEEGCESGTALGPTQPRFTHLASASTPQPHQVSGTQQAPAADTSDTLAE